MKHLFSEPAGMNLQLFAEAETSADGMTGATGTTGAAGMSGADNATGAAGTEESAGTLEAEKRFTQAEVDALIEQRLARWKRDESKRIEEARTEAEKLARMSESERTEAERQRAEQALRDRESEIARKEAEIARRELRAQAIETLAGKGLDKRLADMLDYSDADACRASIDQVEKTFRAAVQAGVEQRLKSSAAQLPKGDSAQAEKPLDVQIAERRGAALAEANRRAEEIIKHYTI